MLRQPAAGGLLGAAVALTAMLLPGAAAAQPLSPGCVQSDPAGTVFCTYTSVGTHAVTVAGDVESVQVTAVGGRGDSFTNGPENVLAGGLGASVTTTIALAPQTRTLYAVVGGNGGDVTHTLSGPGSGGSNGGGPGGGDAHYAFSSPGGGGGGASDVRTNATDLISRVVVAAGGGGATSIAAGADASTAGVIDGSGGAATSAEGGSAGIDLYPGASGQPGRLGTGREGGIGPGRSPIPGMSGGGGGGGLYGGGGGAGVIRGPGGGGSSLSPGDSPGAVTGEPASIFISYRTAPQPPMPPCTGSACLPRPLQLPALGSADAVFTPHDVLGDADNRPAVSRGSCPAPTDRPASTSHRRNEVRGEARIWWATGAVIRYA